MNTHPSLGKFELKTRPAKTFLYFAIVVFIVFTAICALIYFGAIIPINQGKASFSGDISVLYKAMAGIMGLAIAILILAVFFMKGATFYLYEQGIVADYKGNEKVTKYADIQDLYLFTSGKQMFGANNVAYRTNESDEWQAISAKYGNVGKGIKLIRSKHQTAYVPKVLQQLAEGKSVAFHYVEYVKLVATQFFAVNTNSYLNVKPKEMMLYKDKLIVGSETIYLADVQRFSINDWTNQIKLLNKENKTLFAISFYSVLSGDSFISVLDELINKQ
ncbi:DUF6585 family protein [Chitinophagaceae bacterium LWZ2-11]